MEAAELHSAQSDCNSTTCRTCHTCYLHQSVPAVGSCRSSRSSQLLHNIVALTRLHCFNDTTHRSSTTRCLHQAPQVVVSQIYVVRHHNARPHHATHRTSHTCFMPKASQSYVPMKMTLASCERLLRCDTIWSTATLRQKQIFLCLILDDQC